MTRSCIDTATASGGEHKIFFKNGTILADAAPGKQSWVLDPGHASHLNLPRYYYQTEATAGEYDVPPAFPEPSLNLP